MSKAPFIYVALACIAVNIGGNLAAKTAEGLQNRVDARTAQLCQVNPVYCD